MEKKLELRMYFFTPYNISDIQKGIQCGHAALRYALKYGRNNPNHPIWEFIENFETWIILNGGTTNSRIEMIDFNEPIGSLNKITENIMLNGIESSLFREIDLNDALTSVCFLCDERVFNRVDYPDFDDWYNPVTDKEDMRTKWEVKLDTNYNETLFEEWYSEKTQRELKYDKWLEMIGGAKNEFLRTLIKDKKLA